MWWMHYKFDSICFTIISSTLNKGKVKFWHIVNDYETKTYSNVDSITGRYENDFDTGSDFVFQIIRERYGLTENKME